MTRPRLRRQLGQVLEVLHVPALVGANRHRDETARLTIMLRNVRIGVGDIPVSASATEPRLGQGQADAPPMDARGA